MDTEAIERVIAEKKNKKERHDFKWKAFLDELSATQRRTQIVWHHALGGGGGILLLQGKTIKKVVIENAFMYDVAMT